MSIAALFAISGFLRFAGPTQDVQSFPGFQIEGVAMSQHIRQFHGNPTGIGAAVRLRGQLPSDGTWYLRITGVTDTDGKPLAVDRPMTFGMPASTTGQGPLVFSPIKGSAPDEVRVTGELVHSFGVQDTATFPPVTLKHVANVRPKGQPPMRDWFLPDGVPYSATTKDGLRLREAHLGGYGYSGPGYNDLARIPLKVDPSTLKRGLGSDLRKGRGLYVDRVEIWPSTSPAGSPSVLIYDSSQPTLYGMVTTEDAQFSNPLTLSVRILRQVVDKRYRFTLKLPVQQNRQLDPGSNSKVAPAIWPDESHAR